MMAGFIVFKKFTQEEAERTIADLSAWFEANPKRRVCRTDLGFKVRRNKIRQDIGPHCMPGVFL